MLDGYRPLVEFNDAKPSVDDVEWAKALIAAPLTDETAAHLIQVVRGGDDGRAQMAAWALGFGVLPGSSRMEFVEGLLLVVVDTTRSAEVRAHAAEAVAEQLRFEDQDDRLQEVATARLVDTLDDASGMVRFWSAFALGQLHAAWVARASVRTAGPRPAPRTISSAIAPRSPASLFRRRRSCWERDSFTATGVSSTTS